MSYSNVSKSTKRRRFLEDVETINFLVENQQPQILTQLPSTPHDTDFNLSVDVQKSALSNINCNYSICDNIIAPIFPLSNNAFSNDNENIVIGIG